MFKNIPIFKYLTYTTQHGGEEVNGLTEITEDAWSGLLCCGVDAAEGNVADPLPDDAKNDSKALVTAPGLAKGA